MYSSFLYKKYKEKEERKKKKRKGKKEKENGKIFGEQFTFWENTYETRSAEKGHASAHTSGTTDERVYEVARSG
jgi:hypothetical protein